jgi:hypothetical protein
MNECGLKLTPWSLKEQVLKLDYVHVDVDDDDDDDECKTKFLGKKVEQHLFLRYTLRSIEETSEVLFMLQTEMLLCFTDN